MIVDVRSRDDGLKSKSWCCGINSTSCSSARHVGTDHLIVLNEEHLRRILGKFSAYYNAWRPHVSLGKDAPNRRSIEMSFPKIISARSDDVVHPRQAQQRRYQTVGLNFRE